MVDATEAGGSGRVAAGGAGLDGPEGRSGPIGEQARPSRRTRQRAAITASELLVRRQKTTILRLQSMIVELEGRLALATQSLHVDDALLSTPQPPRQKTV